MSNLGVIENKISSIQKYLKILGGYKGVSEEKILKDINLKGALERYLYLAVQSTIDLAEAVLSYKKFRKPTTMSEVFYILGEEDIIDQDLASKLANMVGFRNIIAHDYEELNYDIVFAVLKERLKDIEKFVSIISELK